MSSAVEVADPPGDLTAQVPSAGSDLGAAGRSFLRGVRGLPGVARVFPQSSGVGRWFVGPVTGFVVDGDRVDATVTIGVDRHHPAAGTTGLVGAFLHARLQEAGFETTEVRVRVALLT